MISGHFCFLEAFLRLLHQLSNFHQYATEPPDRPANHMVSVILNTTSYGLFLGCAMSTKRVPTNGISILSGLSVPHFHLQAAIGFHSGVIGT